MGEGLLGSEDKYYRGEDADLQRAGGSGRDEGRTYINAHTRKANALATRKTPMPIQKAMNAVVAGSNAINATGGGSLGEEVERSGSLQNFGGASGPVGIRKGWVFK